MNACMFAWRVSSVLFEFVQCAASLRCCFICCVVLVPVLYSLDLVFHFDHFRKGDNEVSNGDFLSVP